MYFGTIRCTLFLGALSASIAQSPVYGTNPVVPGTGQQVASVGDDFENQPDWRYFPNYPKSSRNIDKRERGPLGQSKNGRWLEGPHRGTPDLMHLVETPLNGLPGSESSLLIRSLRPGVPRKVSGEPQQDDIMVKVKRRVGRPVAVSTSPNCVVRVFVPPYPEWEDRTGASFGFRSDVWGKKPGSRELEQYWPGIFINFRSETDRRFHNDSAYIMIRGDEKGRDIRGPEVSPGWWTLGLSVSPDGMCHFYAREGVDDLQREDRLGSYFCYGFRAERMDLFFFNIVTMDDGRTWSTPWVIDDPAFYSSPLLARISNPFQKKKRR